MIDLCSKNRSLEVFRSVNGSVEVRSVEVECDCRECRSMKCSSFDSGVPATVFSIVCERECWVFC